jgi:enoyl-CoA hydratase
MTDDQLLVSKADGVVTITLNRPEVRNALTPAMWEMVEQTIKDIQGDDEAEVIIFTGAGDKAFAAGADIQWLRDRGMLPTLEGTLQRVLQTLESLWKPSIAAINGYAVGGGCELALACDIRIASDRAKIGLPEVRLGILPGGGGTQRLTRLVGVGKAKEMIFTGAIVDAVEAERIGLVNRVVPHAQVLEEAIALAQKIQRRGPMAVRLAKLAIDTGVRYGPGPGYVSEQLAQTVLFGTEDKIEGTSAFLEKRPPEFKGR